MQRNYLLPLIFIFGHASMLGNEKIIVIARSVFKAHQEELIPAERAIGQCDHCRIQLCNALAKKHLTEALQSQRSGPREEEGTLYQEEIGEIDEMIRKMKPSIVVSLSGDFMQEESLQDAMAKKEAREERRRKLRERSSSTELLIASVAGEESDSD